MTTTFPKCRLRIVLAPGVAFGPGKADLLQGLEETGSIRAAGRRLGMSYKRAWTLVGALNRDFEHPLVVTEKGGSGGGGGAQLTDLGKSVLAHFRRLEGLVYSEGADDIAALVQVLRTDLDADGEAQ